MVGTTALVAGWADTAGKAATATIAAETSTRDRDAATKSRAAGVGRGSAGADVVTELAAVVATAISSGATDAECRAVGLHVAQALAVVALLGFCRARQRAFAGLVVGLLAVVAKPVGRSASLGVMAELTAFVACATRERRHLDCCNRVSVVRIEKRARGVVSVQEASSFSGSLLDFKKGDIQLSSDRVRIRCEHRYPICHVNASDDGHLVGAVPVTPFFLPWVVERLDAGSPKSETLTRGPDAVGRRLTGTLR